MQTFFAEFYGYLISLEFCVKTSYQFIVSPSLVNGGAVASC